MNLSVSYRSLAIDLTNMEQNVMTTVLLIRRSKKLNFFPTWLGGWLCYRALGERCGCLWGGGRVPRHGPLRADGALCCELAGPECLLHSQLQAGIPQVRAGKQSFPEESAHLAAVGGNCAVGCAGGGRGTEGMTGPAPPLSVSQSSVSQKRLF